MTSLNRDSERDDWRIGQRLLGYVGEDAGIAGPAVRGAGSKMGRAEMPDPVRHVELLPHDDLGFTARQTIENAPQDLANAFRICVDDAVEGRVGECQRVVRRGHVHGRRAIEQGLKHGLFRHALTGRDFRCCVLYRRTGVSLLVLVAQDGVFPSPHPRRQQADSNPIPLWIQSLIP